MLNRFKEELNGILREKNIHLSSGILEDCLIQIAKIDKNELAKSAQEDAKNALHLSSNDKPTPSIYLSVTAMLPSAVTKLCNFISVDPTKRCEGQSLIISKECLAKKIKPAVVKWFNNLSPEELNNYQIHSLKGLEEDAVNHIRHTAGELVGKLNEIRKAREKRAESGKPTKFADRGFLGPKQNALLQVVLQLENISDNIRTYEYYHENIRDTLAPHLQSLKTRGLHYKKLDALLGHIQNYVKYNRQDAVLANKALIDELEDFVRPYKMSVSHCDVFEETLLLCAGIASKPKESLLDKSYFEPSRMLIKFIDFSAKEAGTLVDFLRAFDKTVMLDPKGSFGGYYDDEALYSIESASLSVVNRAPKKPVEKHEISIDGLALRGKIFPLFKAKFLEKAQTEEFIAPYQKQSADYLASLQPNEEPTYEAQSKTKSKTKPTLKRGKQVAAENAVRKSEKVVILPLTNSQLASTSRTTSATSVVSSQNTLFAQPPTNQDNLARASVELEREMSKPLIDESQDAEKSLTAAHSPRSTR